jgi:ABC-type multidrug transport system, permease component
MHFRSLLRIVAIAQKEWIHLRRDKRSLLLSIGLPIAMLFLFGYALSMDVKQVKTAVYDQDRTPLSRSLIEKFSHTEYISICKYVNTPKEIESLLDKGEIIMAFVIPREFEKMYLSGKDVDVQLLVDGSDSSSAMVATGYVKMIMFEFNSDLTFQGLNKSGITDLRIPVDVRTRVWYNPQLKSRNFIISGTIVVVMAIISALITSLTIAKEWEMGTMETLITTPVRKYELFFGKLIPYIMIALFDVVLTVSAGYFIFDMPMKGSVVELYIVSLLFLIGTSGLGLLISSSARSQVLAIQVALLVTYMPAIILSGYIFPIKNMPAIIQGITYFVPARYLIFYMKGITMKGIGFTLMWSQVIFLFLFAVIVVVISLKKISFKLDVENKS